MGLYNNDMSGLGEALLACDVGYNPDKNTPTTKATGDVQKEVDMIIPEDFSETNSPYNQTPRWSDNCVTDLNGTVFMDNGRWDMIPCPNC